MASFKFKLEPVLRHRRIQEEQAQRELAKAFGERVMLQQRLRGMQDTIITSKRQLGDGLVGRVDLDAVSGFARYSLQVAATARGMLGQLVQAEKQIEARRIELTKAMQARKALELLRDKQHRAWQAEQARREDAALDELAVQAYSRRLMSGDRA